jgi:hypothetical protein
VAKTHNIDEAAWEEWKNSRPPTVKAICERLRPDRLYRLKTTGQRVTMHSINEDGTVTVDITGEYNHIDFAYSVFWINPDDLEECELPQKDELLGEWFTHEVDIEAYGDQIRPNILHARGIRSCAKHPTLDPACKVCVALITPPS